MEKMDAGIKMAHRAVDTRYEDLGEQEALVTKLAILDTLGVILAGGRLGNKCREIVSLVKEWGGKEESTILGFGGKVPAMMAAFANGAVVHCLDYDDAHDGGAVHPTAACLPSALAVMETYGGLSGKDLITAVAVGNDVVCRMGLASPAAIAVGGLLAPMTIAVFGAATAAGKIMGLTKEQMVNCLGLALTQASGSAQVLHEGDSDVREIYEAFSGKAGVLAAVLAQRGIRGCRNSLEGKNGFFNLLLNGNYDPSFLNVKTGDRFEGVNVTFKPYPSCRQTHAYIDATRHLIDKHAITPAKVDKVLVSVGRLGEKLCTPVELRRRPALASDAKFSIPYTVATCLVHGTVGLENFIQENIGNPNVLEMSQMVEWEFNAELGKSTGVEPGIVTIQCKDGNIYSKEVSNPFGSPENPMSTDAIVAKFRDCAAYSIKPIKTESVDRIIDLCLHLEEINSIDQVIQLVS